MLIISYGLSYRYYPKIMLDDFPVETAENRHWNFRGCSHRKLRRTPWGFFVAERTRARQALISGTGEALGESQILVTYIPIWCYIDIYIYVIWLNYIWVTWYIYIYTYILGPYWSNIGYFEILYFELFSIWPFQRGVTEAGLLMGIGGESSHGCWLLFHR